MVLHNLKDALRLLAQHPDDQSALNNLLASGERLSALVVAHRLQEYGYDAYPLGAEDIGITLMGIIKPIMLICKHRVSNSIAKHSAAHRSSQDGLEKVKTKKCNS